MSIEFSALKTASTLIGKTEDLWKIRPVESDQESINLLNQEQEYFG